MKKEDIHWADWHRILIGNAPTAFLIEVLIRSIIMYLALLIILQLMGKRMGGQLTMSDMAVLITLGAIVCVPMQIPESGILEGILVLLCALIFLRGFNLLGFKSDKMEKISLGKECILVKNGTMLVDEMKKTNISKEELFTILRSQKIINLGEVDRIYFEAYGSFSVYKNSKPKPGLSLLPKESLYKIQKTTNAFACKKCGGIVNSKQEAQLHCKICDGNEWEPAIL